MDAREVKAVKLTGDLRITFKEGDWLVPSQSSPSTRYTVNPSVANPSCTCDDFQKKKKGDIQNSVGKREGCPGSGEEKR